MGRDDDTLAETGGGDLYGPVLGAGAQVGRFTIDERMAQGAFGNVYRAHDPAGDPAAIKVLHQLFLHVPDVIKRFHREAETVRRLRHANIVKLLDFGELADGRPYLAMDWLDGPTLDDALHRGGAMPLARTLEVMEGLCAGLAAAHAAGVVHRDLKGSNVILVPGSGTRREVATLVDFGVAKLVDRVGTRLTVTGVRIGTPSCMAPEQIKGGAITAATDIYALGVLVHRAVTGSYPFQAKNVVEMEAMHLHVAPPRASDCAPEAECVDEVVLRAMAKDPAQRPPSVDAFLAELRAAILRPAKPSAVRKESVPAIAIHVSHPTSDVAARLAEARLVIVRDVPDTVVGVAQLPRHPRAAREMRKHIVALACILARELPGRSVAVNVGPATRRIEGTATTFVGGELLAVDEWATGTPGVTASDDAMDDLEEKFRSFSGPTPGMRTLVL